jgi:hypothetical protein
VDDGAAATVAALAAEPGVYNVVDDDPEPVARWLPDVNIKGCCTESPRRCRI